jgi:succinate dehydrogenase / fumarate reductase, iron-sulfur subunit
VNLTLRIWRQKDAKSPGRFQVLQATDIASDCSFLEMLDLVNERLETAGEEPVAFDHDCREGICGMCSLVVNGVPHGPDPATTSCQLIMRRFKDGDTITIEPWRSRAFPVLRDLIVDRSALDRIIQAGGYISVNTGSAPEANMIAVPRPAAEAAFDGAACIGCGACVAACPNASAMLFVSAKITHLASLPQGQPERLTRAQAMVRQMDAEGFGNCTNHGECEAVCPQEIKMTSISRMNADFVRSSFRLRELPLRRAGK